MTPSSKLGLEEWIPEKVMVPVPSDLDVQRCYAEDSLKNRKKRFGRVVDLPNVSAVTIADEVCKSTFWSVSVAIGIVKLVFNAAVIEFS